MNQPLTLAIDIGGSGIKAALLDTGGSMIGKRQRVPTPPKPVAPEALVGAIDKAASPLGDFERVSVGFPGYVRDGRVLTAPNLGSDYVAAFERIYPDLAAKYHTLLYPFFLEGSAGDLKLTQADGLHPNAAGVGVIVAHILPTVLQLIDQIHTQHPS